MNKNNKGQMHIIAQLSAGQGLEPGGWRWPGEDKAAFINEDVFINGAQLAEKGKLDGFFLVDVPAISDDIAKTPQGSSLDPIVLMALMAKATERVGLISTMSTSIKEPYSIARTMRTLDLVSKGRMGWNVVTTGNPRALLNYFAGTPEHGEKHGRAREVWEAVLRLWGSWPEGALKLDVASGVFADDKLIQPINFQGEYVSSRGPINLPPSPQGMPVIFTAGGGEYGYNFAATKADAMYGNPPTLEYAAAFWQQLSASIKHSGRNPDQFTIFNGIGVSIASSEKEALERRIALDELGEPVRRQQYLSHMLSIPIAGLDIDAPIPDHLLKLARPNRTDHRSQYAYDLAMKGFTIREVLAHGPINYHPVFLGTPESIADKLQQWFEAGVGKGFNIIGDSGLSSLADFVEQVVPILQKRGLLRSEYTGSTLREHLGLPYRNGFAEFETKSAHAI
ncbi:NtaA/DmoA family FMN-dependent monooxygenase [Desertivirga xinjiangensis]|uniref:NtaA/DmoA family FMN-dependent monooxygenase n=1 Tax=Desertivirga xinjiangensis TaxID=539206 RepID=UPI0021097D6A|nr:NtaA/DmoA family FMN-dependent monooxygenase [Pedobacter xinjiangensis]